MNVRTVISPVKTVPQRIKSFPCHWCGLEFERSATLTEHMRTHADEHDVDDEVVDEVPERVKLGVVGSDVLIDWASGLAADELKSNFS